MKISSILIKNFKGINDLVLDLSRNPNPHVFTLIGLNESGKTSILEAISLFYSKPKEEYHKLIPKSQKFSFSKNIEIEIKYNVEEKDNDQILKFVNENQNLKHINPLKQFSISTIYKYQESEHIENKYVWDIDLQVVKKKGIHKVHSLDENNPEWGEIIKFIKNNILPDIIYYPNFLFDFPEKIYLDEIADKTEEGRQYKLIIQDILNSIQGDLTIQKNILDKLVADTPSSKSSLESLLLKMSSTVSEIVTNAWSETISSSERKEIGIKWYEEDLDGLKTSNRYFLEFTLKEGSNSFYIHERSLGFKWFFSFLLFTEFRKYRVDTLKGDILFLLDEPASNLHSTAQKKLLSTFSRIVTRASLIYTTHSHYLINPDWLNGAYIVKNKAIDYDDNKFSFNTGDTDIEAIPYRQFIAQNPKQKDYFQPILDCLKYQPGLLENVPNIILTEGKNDFYTLKYFEKCILNKNGNESLHFYPGTGADHCFEIIALYLAWNRPFIVLLDGDRAGEAAKKSYIKEFGALIEKSIITLSDIDKSFEGKSMEDLFSEKDKFKINQYVFTDSTEYKKSEFNTSMQSLLIEEKKITLEKGSISNLKKVFDCLEGVFEN